MLITKTKVAPVEPPEMYAVKMDRMELTAIIYALVFTRNHSSGFNELGAMAEELKEAL